MGKRLHGKKKEAKTGVCKDNGPCGGPDSQGRCKRCGLQIK